MNQKSNRTPPKALLGFLGFRRIQKEKKKEKIMRMFITVCRRGLGGAIVCSAFIKIGFLAGRV